MKKHILPAVCPGVSITLNCKSPTCIVSPSFTKTSAMILKGLYDILEAFNAGSANKGASFSQAQTIQPYFSLTSSTAPIWSKCPCVSSI